jgi:predicted HAD superfamily Cof-like phosphohydrolase
MARTVERVLPAEPSGLGTSQFVRYRCSADDAPGRQPLSEPMQCVLQFHRAFGLPGAARPLAAATVPAGLAELRIALLVEEVQEFADAARSGDLVALADALADIAYVTYGAALTYGIDLDAVLREIHRANMSKLGPDGRPVLRGDGKVLKPATYRPPDVQAVLAVQLPLPFDDTF